MRIIVSTTELLARLCSSGLPLLRRKVACSGWKAQLQKSLRHLALLQQSSTVGGQTMFNLKARSTVGGQIKLNLKARSTLQLQSWYSYRSKWISYNQGSQLNRASVVIIALDRRWFGAITQLCVTIKRWTASYEKAMKYGWFHHMGWNRP